MDCDHSGRTQAHMGGAFGYHCGRMGPRPVLTGRWPAVGAPATLWSASVTEGCDVAGTEVCLVFSGHTALLRAWHALRDRGIPCAVRAAPAGASPCGWALALQEKELRRATEFLAELGVAPTVLGPSPATGGSPAS